MIALLRYVMAVMLHSQRYLPPLMLFIGVAIMFTGSSDVEPVVPIYGAVAGVLFVCSTWLTVVLVNVENPVRRSITMVNVGRSPSVLIANMLVALAVCLLVAVPLLGFPMLVGNHTITPTGILVGLLAQLTGACTGVAIGLAVSRLVIPRPGHSLLAALALVAFFLLIKGVPPVNPMIRLLTNSSDVTADLLSATAVYAGIAIAVLVASLSLTQFVAVRRD